MHKFITAGVLVLVLLSGAVSGTSYVQANGQTIAKVNEIGVYYYHTDHLGSTSAVTDSDGEVVEEQVNFPFGERISGTEKHGFTGKEFEPDLDLNYFMARYYDPNSGRFLNSDPAQDGVNWYAYAGNNPLKFIDPTGKWFEVSGYTSWFGLKQGDLKRLIKQTEEKTRFTLGIHRVFGLRFLYIKSIDETKGSPTDETKGSPTFQQLMIDLCLGKNLNFLKKEKERSGNIQAAASGHSPDKADIIYLTPEHFKLIKTYGVNQQTIDEAMALAHEGSHNLYGTVDPEPVIEDNKFVYPLGDLGTAVEYMNKIREELKLPLRVQYHPVLSRDGSIWVRFDKWDIYIGHLSDFPYSVTFQFMNTKIDFIEPRLKQRE